MVTITFVGGPHDGERKVVEDEYRGPFVFARTERVVCSPRVGPDYTDVIHDEYLPFQSTGDHAIYHYAGLTSAEVIMRLATRYMTTGVNEKKDEHKKGPMYSNGGFIPTPSALDRTRAQLIDSTHSEVGNLPYTLPPAFSLGSPNPPITADERRRLHANL
jgi:hypothetical protein